MAKRFVIRIKSPTDDCFAYLGQHHKNEIRITQAIDQARLYKGLGYANETIRHNKKTMLKECCEFFDYRHQTHDLIVEIIPVRVEVYAESI